MEENIKQVRQSILDMCSKYGIKSINIESTETTYNSDFTYVNAIEIKIEV